MKEAVFTLNPSRVGELAGFKARNPLVSTADIADYFSIKWGVEVTGEIVTGSLRRYYSQHHNNQGCEVSFNEAQEGLEAAIKYLQQTPVNSDTQIQHLNMVLLYITNLATCKVGPHLRLDDQENNTNKTQDVYPEQEQDPDDCETLDDYGDLNSEGSDDQSPVSELNPDPALSTENGGPTRKRKSEQSKDEPGIKRKLGRPITNTPGPLQCATCGKWLRNLRALEIHERIHTKELPYSCDVCGEMFRDLSSLGKHRKRIHIGGQHKCDQCDRSFLHSSDLKQHQQSHGGEARFSCEVCDHGFHYKSQLGRHMLTHWQDPQLSCTVCEKKFRYPWHLKEHMSVHDTEKRYSCETCHQTFTHANSARVHARSHTDDKPHQCETCGKRFCFSSQLDNHSRMHSVETPFKCQICAKEYRWKTSLMKHELSHSKTTRNPKNVQGELISSAGDVLRKILVDKPSIKSKPVFTEGHLEVFNGELAGESVLVRPTETEMVIPSNPADIGDEGPETLVLDSTESGTYYEHDLSTADVTDNEAVPPNAGVIYESHQGSMIGQPGDSIVSDTVNFPFETLNTEADVEYNMLIVETPAENMENSTEIQENPTRILENTVEILENPMQIIDNSTQHIEEPIEYTYESGAELDVKQETLVEETPAERIIIEHEGQHFEIHNSNLTAEDLQHLINCGHLDFHGLVKANM